MQPVYEIDEKSMATIYFIILQLGITGEKKALEISNSIVDPGVCYW